MSIYSVYSWRKDFFLYRSHKGGRLACVQLFHILKFYYFIFLKRFRTLLSVTKIVNATVYKSNHLRQLKIKFISLNFLIHFLNAHAHAHLHGK